ncbi:hypothetical protein L9F63_025054, partial [Diploptera punctata]
AKILVHHRALSRFTQYDVNCSHHKLIKPLIGLSSVLAWVETNPSTLVGKLG